MSIAASCNETHLDHLSALVTRALLSPASDRAVAEWRLTIVITCFGHASASWTGVPQWKSQERQFQSDVDGIYACRAINLTEIRWLNKKIYAQATR
ncbi:hypothetical protein BED46_036890 [Burkholderia contaminans]|nr:hypothetical protein BED46_036890 [Burkholderia contaminans]